MRKKLRLISWSAGTLAFLFFVPAGAEEKPLPLKKIHLPIPSTSSSFAPFAVAKKRGFYQ